MTSSDKNVVGNLRFQYKDRVEAFTDEQLAEAWRNFSQSEDYEKRDEDDTLFLLWIE